LDTIVPFPDNRPKRTCVGCLVFVMAVWSLGLVLPGAKAQSNSPAAQGVRISKDDGKLVVEVNGKLFTEYHYQGAARPYFYPLLGPDELPVTRRWPMENTSDEEHDHVHHRSLWYAHASVNGLDFWDETNKTCRIVHDRFLAIESGEKSGLIKSTDNWMDRDGQIVCTDTRIFRVYNRTDNQRLFDFEITLQAPPEHPVVFGDEKDGTMAVRIAESMRLKHKNKPGDGHIVLSTGARDGNTWGKRADWCDYYGPVNGRTVGIAIFDHPDNPRHPTWWHVRDYGLFAANPFGVHFFENKPAGTGNLTIPPGQSITFRYRFYIHEGDEREAHVADAYAEYCRTPSH
jgi:Methane oxygenase PmoA